MLYQTLSHTLKLAPHESPSRRTLNNYAIFYAKPSRKTLNKFGKPSTTLIIPCYIQSTRFTIKVQNTLPRDICLLFKLLGGEIYLAVLWYTFVHFILHIHPILHFCVLHLKFLEPKWSQQLYHLFYVIQLFLQII